MLSNIFILLHNPRKSVHLYYKRSNNHSIISTFQIESKAFYGLKNLTELYLRGNGIQNVCNFNNTIYM